MASKEDLVRKTLQKLNSSRAKIFWLLDKQNLRNSSRIKTAHAEHNVALEKEQLLDLIQAQQMDESEEKDIEDKNKRALIDFDKILTKFNTFADVVQEFLKMEKPPKPIIKEPVTNKGNEKKGKTINSNKLSKKVFKRYEGKSVKKEDKEILHETSDVEEDVDLDVTSAFVQSTLHKVTSTNQEGAERAKNFPEKVPGLKPIVRQHKESKNETSDTNISGGMYFDGAVGFQFLMDGLVGKDSQKLDVPQKLDIQPSEILSTVS